MRALVTGITGQDGSYLAQTLVARGDDVCGLVRSDGPLRRSWLGDRLDEIKIVQGDLTDPGSLRRAVEVAQPDVIFNLAAVTTPGEVLTDAPLVSQATGLGVWSLLAAMRDAAPNARIVHASSSAVHAPLEYGAYGLAKQFAHNAVHVHRRFAGIHASNAILYSHTSPRQSHRFLVRQLVRACARMRPGQPLRDPGVRVTNLVNRRDWGWAPDYARALIHIADAEPGDYTVRTGTTWSVGDVLMVVAEHLGLDPGYFVRSWRQASRVVTRLEIEPGEPAPAPPGWSPSVTFKEIIGALVEDELRDDG